MFGSSNDGQTDDEQMDDDTATPTHTRVGEVRMTDFIEQTDDERRLAMTQYADSVDKVRKSQYQEMNHYQLRRQWKPTNDFIRSTSINYLVELMQELHEVSDNKKFMTRIGPRMIDGESYMWHDCIEEFGSIGGFLYYLAQSVDAFDNPPPYIVSGELSVKNLVFFAKEKNPEIAEDGRYDVPVKKMDGEVLKTIIMAVVEHHDNIPVMEYLIGVGEGGPVVNTSMTSYTTLFEQFGNDLEAAIYWIIWMHFKSRSAYGKKKKESMGNSNVQKTYDVNKIRLPWSIKPHSVWGQVWATTPVEERPALLKKWLEEDRSRFKTGEAEFIRRLQMMNLIYEMFTDKNFFINYIIKIEIKINKFHNIYPNKFYLLIFK